MSSWHSTFSSSYMKGRPRVVISLLHIHRRESKPEQSTNTREVRNSRFKQHKLCSEMLKTWFVGGAVPSQSRHISSVGRKQQVDNRLDLEENRGVVCGALMTSWWHHIVTNFAQIARRSQNLLGHIWALQTCETKGQLNETNTYLNNSCNVFKTGIKKQKYTPS